MSTHNLGDAIRRARKQAGLSQRELAQALSVSDKAVSSYEVGRATPSLQTLQALGRVVNKPLSYFDENAHTGSIDLQIKLAQIEKELLEVKKLLSDMKESDSTSDKTD